MSRVSQAIAAEPWAITPDALQLIARIVARHDAGVPQEEPAYLKRDLQLMAGPRAERLPGAQRAFLVGDVAVLPVTGPIFPRANMITEFSGGTSVTMLQNDFRVALNDANVYGIMLLIDSPGGAVSGIAAFADQLAAGAKKKLTRAYVAGTGASAAYWIASQAEQISLERTSAVGSIGVVAAVPVQIAPEAETGTLWVEIVSSNAPNKRPDPVADDGRAEIVATLDAIEKQFVADVAKGRKTTAAKVTSEFGRGGIKIGADAVGAGMVDKVESYEAALAALQREAANRKRAQALKQ